MCLAKRIAIILPTLHGGGAERVSLSLAQKFLQWGYEVDFVLLRAVGELMPDVPDAARIIDLGTGRMGMTFNLAKYLRREKPDAVLVHMWPLTSATIIAQRLARVSTRLLVCDHNPLLEAMQHAGKATWYNVLALRLSLRLTYPLATARIAVSRGVAHHLAELSALDPADFTVIYNPISSMILEKTDDEAAENAWQGWRGKRLLTVGRFTRAKNHPLLLRAFKRLLEWQDARLMILGKGELEEETRNLIKELGIEDKVLMPGFVDNPAPYYRSADLFVLSSDYEGLSLVLMEALACGTPIVSTRCPTGPGEILEDGKYGLLVPPGDEEALAAAMHKALKEPVPPDLLQKRAADFSLENVARQYLKVMGLQHP